MKNLILVFGPTAVGKTEASIQLSAPLGAEIVNADSRQVYREMNIGTARPTEAELARARFHFVGCLSIRDRYSAAKYEADALRVISQLHEHADNVILSGGSMLYINAVINGIDDIPEIPAALRAELKSRCEAEGLQSLCRELARLDPEYYSLVDRNNPRRVIHGLEVCLFTGKTYTSFRLNTAKPRHFRTIKIGLNLPRPELFARINRRVDNMMEAGFLEEARRLYPFRNLDALNTVGYKELFKYIDGEFPTLTQAVERLKKNTRVYAKKQLTWFKTDSEMHWFAPTDIAGIVRYLAGLGVPIKAQQ